MNKLSPKVEGSNDAHMALQIGVDPGAGESVSVVCLKKRGEVIFMAPLTPGPDYFSIIERMKKEIALAIAAPASMLKERHVHNKRES